MKENCGKYLELLNDFRRSRPKPLFENGGDKNQVNKRSGFNFRYCQGYKHEDDKNMTEYLTRVNALNGEWMKH